MRDQTFEHSTAVEIGVMVNGEQQTDLRHAGLFLRLKRKAQGTGGDNTIYIEPTTQFHVPLCKNLFLMFRQNGWENGMQYGLPRGMRIKLSLTDYCGFYLHLRTENLNFLFR